MTHIVAKYDDGLDDDFIEEEWQFVRDNDDDDDDDDSADLRRPITSFSFDDEDENADDCDTDDSGDFEWDAGTEDEESANESFDGWTEDSDKDEE